jgi:hypothetical protein
MSTMVQAIFRQAVKKPAAKWGGRRDATRGGEPSEHIQEKYPGWLVNIGTSTT